ncbi:MAG: redoxin domain-containing protein [Desulfobulbaceae bacterium]|nr:redoxin domain-containing protein [Desulfobulbaceae bacterium]
MAKILVNAQAPDFTLPDVQGVPITLMDFREKAVVYLVLNRGFS